MKVVWGVILFNLVAIGLALLSVILHPAEMKAWMTTDLAEQAKLIAQKTDEQTGGIQEQLEKVDILNKPTPTPRRTPPPAVDPEKLLEPTVEAFFEGDYFGEQSFGSPPPASLYPMSLRRRQITEDGKMELEILMRNGSGFQFNNVNIFVRSPDYPRTQLFTLDRWKDNEIALLTYVFPEEEQEVRLKNLRVLRVTGEQVDSVLSTQLRERKEQLQGELGIGEEDDVDPTAVNMKSIVLVMPDDIPILPEVPETGISPTTPEREEILAKYDEAYKSLYMAQEVLKSLVAEVEEEGFESTMVNGTGLDLINQILEHRSAFSTKAARIVLDSSRSRDEEVRSLVDLTREKSEALDRQITAINTQIPLVQYRILKPG